MHLFVLLQSLVSFVRSCCLLAPVSVHRYETTSSDDSSSEESSSSGSDDEEDEEEEEEEVEGKQAQENVGEEKTGGEEFCNEGAVEVGKRAELSGSEKQERRER